MAKPTRTPEDAGREAAQKIGQGLQDMQDPLKDAVAAKPRTAVEAGLEQGSDESVAYIADWTRGFIDELSKI